MWVCCVYTVYIWGSIKSPKVYLSITYLKLRGDRLLCGKRTNGRPLLAFIGAYYDLYSSVFGPPGAVTDIRYTHEYQENPRRLLFMQFRIKPGCPPPSSHIKSSSIKDSYLRMPGLCTTIFPVLVWLTDLAVPPTLHAHKLHLQVGWPKALQCCRDFLHREHETKLKVNLQVYHVTLI